MKKKLENYKHLIKVFLLVKVTLSMMDHENFLIFQPTLNTFTVPAGVTETIVAWESTWESFSKNEVA